MIVKLGGAEFTGDGTGLIPDGTPFDVTVLCGPDGTPGLVKAVPGRDYG